MLNRFLFALCAGTTLVVVGCGGDDVRSPAPPEVLEEIQTLGESRSALTPVCEYWTDGKGVKRGDCCAAGVWCDFVYNRDGTVKTKCVRTPDCA